MSRLRGAEPFLVAAAALGSAAVLFIFVPLAALFLLLDPGALAEVASRQPYAPEVAAAFATTFTASGLSTALVAAAGVPLGYLLARRDFAGKALVESLVDIPLMLPHVVAGIMLLVAYGRRGLLPLGIEDTFWGVVAVMAFVSAPIMVDTAKAGFASVDESLERVARSLGATPGRAFLTVTLPLASRSILAGAILSWARALSEVGALLIVAYYPKTVNILVLEYFNAYGLRFAVALAAPLAALAIALFAALRVVVRGAKD